MTTNKEFQHQQRLNLLQSFTAAQKTVRESLVFVKSVSFSAGITQTNGNGTGTGPFASDHYLATRDSPVTFFLPQGGM